MEMLRDLEKDTVKFSLNFDDTLKEPDLLPGRFPNLLVNGSSGIAVGLATNIPPHNMGEAIDAAVMYMDDPEVSLDELMKVMPCPDFPTGGYILESDEITECLRNGQGKDNRSCQGRNRGAEERQEAHCRDRDAISGEQGKGA